ncbi:hypothetical protein FRB90_007319 [Tulasnella sp. 427]|nr:hypothetical protein FRB90_007319 [Tulasnella sp. 427]
MNSTLPPNARPGDATYDEEDELIISRMANDEKILRRLAKRFRTLSSVTKSTEQAPSPHLSSALNMSRDQQVHELRESFLLDVDAFETMLLKNQQVCMAEERMVQQYEAENERIANEHTALEAEIAQLKIDLVEAQLTRKRRMEYDAVAEQINKFASRADLEKAVAVLEEEVSVARTERDKLKEEFISRKLEFDLIVTSLQDIRSRGLGKVDAAQDGAAEDDGQEAKPTGSTLNPNAKPFQPGAGLLSPHSGVPSRPSTPIPAGGSSHLAVPTHLHRSGSRAGSTRSSPVPPTQSTTQPDDDIEMGEVAEDAPTASPPKSRRPKEELEEGEASDLSSELSDPPEE